MDVNNDSNDSVELPLDTRNNIVIENEFQHGINGFDTQLPVGREEYVMDRQYHPIVTIAEQPQSRGFRFRYECEGPSHGGLQGQKSERGRKTYPSIKIDNYRNSARIIVSLVTADESEPPKNHPHKLVGKNCEDGICVMQVKDGHAPIQFQNMSVQHVTKKKAGEVLLKRIKTSIIREKQIAIRDLNAPVRLTPEEEEQAEKMAKDQAKSTQLNVVRLRYQVYIEDHNRQCVIPLEPVYSTPIYDSKSPGAATLKICRMDKYGGCCTGNEEVFLLCEKVQKDDISVRFVEVDINGDTTWEEFGNFGPLDVHRQFAIVFRTPPYKNPNIDRAVNVFIMLQRKSDGEQSDPKSFTYYPQNLDKDEIKKKKRKKIPLDSSYSQFGGEVDGSNGGGSNGYGGGGGQTEYGSRTNQSNSVITNQSALPTTVVQAARDCYDSNPNSPYSPYFHEYSSNLMYGNPDLATDSEPVLPHNSIYATKDFPEEHQDIDDVDGLFERMRVTDIVKPKSTAQVSPQASPRDSSPKQATTIETYAKQVESQAEYESSEFKSVEKAVETESMSLDQKGEAVKIIERTVTAMQDYAETSDIRYLLIVQRHLASVQNTNGDLPVHLAVINEQLPALQSLLGVMATLPNCHVKVNSFNYLRQTPLHLAVLTKQPEAIELLLQHGADPAMMDRAGNTPANLAVQYNSIPCLKSLLKYVRPGVTPTCPFPELNYMNYEGFCPSHIAAQNSSVEMLRLLFFGRASLSLPDGKSGRTPLHHAVESNDISVASFLVMEAEADVNAQCFDGNTPLHMACGRNLVGMTALLISAGADASIENEEAFDEGYGSESGDGTHTGSHRDGDKRGMRPADYVKDNEKILKVLYGDKYIEETIEDDDDLEHDGVDETTSAASTFKSTGLESGLGSYVSMPAKGDMDKLDFRVRLQLSQLLDPVNPGKDIFSLVETLGFPHLNNALEGIKNTDTSPTSFLLDYYETSEGTIQKLRDGLQKLGRRDVITIIDNSIQK